MIELQFPYYGSIEKLHDILSRNRRHLNVAFNKMYGQEMMQVIQKAEAAYLDENAFAEPGIKSRVGFEETGSNSFALAIGSKGETVFEDDGHFTARELTVSPMFCFSENAMGRKREQYEGWVSPYLGPYVHEYNHFAMFALQGSKPMAAAQMIAIGNIRPNRWPMLPEDLLEMVAITEGSRTRKILVAKLAAIAMMLHALQENSTRKIDEQIFRHQGITTPRDYHPSIEGRGYIPIPIIEIQTMVVFPIGDILKDFPPRERARRLRDWAELANFKDPIQRNFLDSFREMTIRIESVTEMLRITEKEPARDELRRIIGRED